MTVEYLEIGHLYLIDGIIVPSVTQIIRSMFQDKYESVPKIVLQAKAEWGNQMHEAIENSIADIAYEPSLSGMQMLQYNQAMSLLRNRYKDNEIKSMKCEEIVHYGNHYAGRYDILLPSRDLIDIKTTAVLDEEYLSWQLGMYQLALGDCTDCYCLHVPKKGPVRLVNIKPKDRVHICKLVAEYEINNGEL